MKNQTKVFAVLEFDWDGDKLLGIDLSFNDAEIRANNALCNTYANIKIVEVPLGCEEDFNEYNLKHGYKIVYKELNPSQQK